jgi:hypothetical protein
MLSAEELLVLPLELALVLQQRRLVQVAPCLQVQLQVHWHLYLHQYLLDSDLLNVIRRHYQCVQV